VGLITSALGQDLERIGYPKGSYVPSLHLTTICIPSTWITPQGSSRELRHSRAGASVAIPIKNSWLHDRRAEEIHDPPSPKPSPPSANLSPGDVIKAPLEDTSHARSREEDEPWCEDGSVCEGVGEEGVVDCGDGEDEGDQDRSWEEGEGGCEEEEEVLGRVSRVTAEVKVDRRNEEGICAASSALR